jgi:hypothetical protein
MSRRALVAASLLLTATSPFLRLATAADLPEGYPAADCATFEDGKGDGKATPLAASGQTPGQQPNDPDLDSTGVAIGTTSTDLVVHMRIDKLAAKPATTGNGHQFEISFSHNAKAVQVYTSQVDAQTASLRGAMKSAYDASAGAAPWAPDTGAKVATKYDPRLKVDATYDLTNSVVILTVDKASLETVTGKPVDGATLTAVSAATKLLVGPDRAIPADTISAEKPADQIYVVGDNRCFGPPDTALTNLGKATLQYGDAATVSAKLLAGTKPLAGKTVTFTLAGKSATAQTGEDGIATTTLAPGAVAGSYSLVASFAGDGTGKASTVSTPFTITQEKTKLTLTVAKSGTRRTVTAKLLDDDNHVVTGQTVNWYVNGKKVSSASTSATGAVTLTTAVAGQTVVADFPAVTGKYLTTKVSQKLT